MNLEILISTCNERLSDAFDVLLPPHDDIRYLIVHQIFDESLDLDKKAENCDSRDDVRVVTTHSKGLSISRNIALQNAKGDVLVIADDDARYSLDGLLELLSTYRDNPNQDIVTCKILTPDGQDYKNYSEKSKSHTRLSVFRVSSLEITARRLAVERGSLNFDEKFGLGTNLPAGEEAIFLADASKKGISIQYEPINIVFHPAESSGSGWRSEESVKARGALFKRVFGFLGFPLLLAFCLKHKKSYSHNFTFKQFTVLAMREYFTFSR